MAELERRLLEARQFLLKSLCMELLRLTSSELQFWDSSSKGNEDIWGGTHLSGIKVRAKEAAFPQAEVLAETIVSLMSPPPTEPYETLSTRVIPFTLL